MEPTIRNLKSVPADQPKPNPVQSDVLPAWINTGTLLVETGFVIVVVRSSVQSRPGWNDSLIPDGLDWEGVFQEALRLRVVPLVSGFLTQHCLNSTPLPVLAKFQQFVRHNTMRNLRMTAELFAIERLSAAAGIQLVPFKGPTLTDLLYRDLSLRAFLDLDIWVEKGNVLAVSRLLHERGYIADLEWEAADDEVFLQTCYQIQFTNAETDLMVELHWEFLPKYLAQDLGPELVKSNLVETKPGGKPLLTLKPEYLLLYLC
ncbi:MAG: nucleotidyltransferase family protein, partial [Blastocatellia bacterium]